MKLTKPTDRNKSATIKNIQYGDILQKPDILITFGRSDYKRHI